MNVYVVLPEYPSQKLLIEKHCFGDCGKIAIGIIDTGEPAGMGLPCTQEECPYEKGRTDQVGTSDFSGDAIFIRALQ